MAKNQKLSFKFFLDGVEVTEIPAEVRKRWCERMSATASRYFSAHPDEYERFLSGLEARGETIRYI